MKRISGWTDARPVQGRTIYHASPREGTDTFSHPLARGVRGLGDPKGEKNLRGRSLPERIVTGMTVACLALVLLPAAAHAQSKSEGIRLFEEALKLDENAQTLDDLKQAVEKYEKSLRIFEKVGFTEGVGVAANNMGMIYSTWGRYDKAVSHYEKSLAIYRELKDRRGEGAALHNLGIVYKDWGQYDKAVRYFEESLEIARDVRDRTAEGNALNNLGIVYMNWSQYDKAVSYYEKSLAISGELKDRRGEGATLHNLGNVYKIWGQHDKAVSYYEKSLAIKRELKDRRGEANTLNNLGLAFAGGGLYDKAISYYEKALAIFRELKDRRGEGNTLNNLGNVYSDWGQYDKAVSYYEKDLAICRQLKDRRGEANTLNNLGLVFADWGRYDKAISYYEKAVSVSREYTNPRDEGRALCNLGRVYAHRGDTDRAKQHMQAGLAIWTEIKVPTRWPKNLIANLYLDEGDLRNAQPLVKEVGDWSTRGRFHLLQSDFYKAKTQYDRLREFAEKNRHAAALFTAYTGLGLSYEGMKDNEKAAEYFQRAVAFTEELRTSLSESEREKFFDVTTEGFLRTVPYEGLARVLMQLKQEADALKTSEFIRARVFAESIAKRSKWWGRGSPPPLTPPARGREPKGSAFNIPESVLKQDRDLNDRLAALKKQRQKAYEKNNKLQIEALEPQIKELTTKRQAHIAMLREKYPLFAATTYPEPMNLDQTAVKPDEWVLAYDVTDPGIIVYLTHGKRLQKALYKAIPRKEIDELVQSFREPLSVKSGDSLTEKLTSFNFTAGHKLANILLAEMLPLLPTGAPVIIVPDDSLGALPFEMLVLNDDGTISTDTEIPIFTGASFFGDRNPISYYQSITALTLARTYGMQNRSAKKLLAIADPIFSMKDQRAQKSVNNPRLAGAEAELYKNLMAPVESGGYGFNFPRLRRTGDMAEQLKKIYHGNATIVTGLKATKATFVNELAPQMPLYGDVVFATHGYFGKDLPGIMEPVLLMTRVPPGTDGYLRMSEVMGLKMNANIVALTACQTGLGRNLSGEGPMSMGRAFQYAGAQSVLMSLWSVAEATSVTLVESFFRHMKEGKSKLESLRLARKEIRDAGYDHPFFWAAFILAGEVE